MSNYPNSKVTIIQILRALYRWSSDDVRELFIDEIKSITKDQIVPIIQTDRIDNCLTTKSEKDLEIVALKEQLKACALRREKNAIIRGLKLDIKKKDEYIKSFISQSIEERNRLSLERNYYFNCYQRISANYETLRRQITH